MPAKADIENKESKMGNFFDPNGNFWGIVGKYASVKDKYGRVHRGRIIDACRADENDSGEDSIGIITHPKERCGSELDRSEIVSIEILNDDEVTDDIRLDKI